MIRNPNAIKYSKNFDRALRKAPLNIKIAFKTRREIFMQNPFHPLLNNHSLTGNYKGFRSINITGDWRALYIQIHEEETIFVMLGKHSKLYG